MDTYERLTAFGMFSLALFVSAVVGIKLDARVTALESKATAPVTETPSSAYVGEFAAERIAGHERGPCTFKAKTERVSELLCIYVRPKEKK